jgi:hypothetical protein
MRSEELRLPAPGQYRWKLICEWLDLLCLAAKSGGIRDSKWRHRRDLEENHGDEENNWAQNGPYRTQGWPQDNTHCPQNWTEGGTSCPQYRTEGGTHYSQNWPQDGKRRPQEGAQALFARDHSWSRVSSTNLSAWSGLKLGS